MMRAILGAAMLTGCAAMDHAPGSGTDSCKAEPAQRLIGRDRSDALLVEARRLSGAREARFLLPDQIVTMEFRYGRVNLSLDAAGKVARVNCG